MEYQLHIPVILFAALNDDMEVHIKYTCKILASPQCIGLRAYDRPCDRMLHWGVIFNPKRAYYSWPGS